MSKNYSMRDKQNAKTHLVSVVGFESLNGKTCLVANDLMANEEVRITVETFSERQKTLDDYQKGFKIGGIHIQAKPETVLAIESCYPQKDGTIKGKSIAFMAENTAEFNQRVDVGLCSSRVLESNGKKFAVNTKYLPPFECAEPKDCYGDIAGHIEGMYNGKPSFILRAVEGNNLLGHAVVRPKADKENGYQVDPNKAYEEVRDILCSMQNDLPEAKFVITPCIERTVSTMDKDQSFFEQLEKKYSFFRDKNDAVVAKNMILKTSENGEFISKEIFVEAYQEGFNVLTLGDELIDANPQESNKAMNEVNAAINDEDLPPVGACEDEANYMPNM